jgi:hypothetical protein
LIDEYDEEEGANDLESAEVTELLGSIIDDADIVLDRLENKDSSKFIESFHSQSYADSRSVSLNIRDVNEKLLGSSRSCMSLDYKHFYLLNCR